MFFLLNLACPITFYLFYTIYLVAIIQHIKKYIPSLDPEHTHINIAIRETWKHAWFLKNKSCEDFTGICTVSLA
jgi:hypothetical protein